MIDTPDAKKEKYIKPHYLVLVKHSVVKSAFKLFGVSKRYVGRKKRKIQKIHDKNLIGWNIMDTKRQQKNGRK